MNSEFKFLEIGSKIGIAKLNSMDSTIYPSQVLDILDPKELVISGPIKRSDLVLIHRDDEIEISFNVKNRGSYYFNAKVLSRDYSNVYTLRIKKTSEIYKVQLRSYFRLPISMEVTKKFKESSCESADILTEVCECKDISGGGMKIYCNYEHKLGDVITCSFKIGDVSREVKSTIVRVEEIDSFNYKYSLGTSFINLSDEIREEIIKYIFEQQRILRLKGMI